MRKWHRWLAIFAGFFLIWIAATGFVGQVMTLAGGEDHDGPPPAASGPSATPPAAGAAASTAAAPPAKSGGPESHGGHKPDLSHFIIDLHSGNYFGIFGKIVSALMGGSLLFFAISGMWMYIDMFRKRKRIGRAGLFWG